MATNSEMVTALKGTKQDVQALKDDLMQKISDGFSLTPTEIAILLACESRLNAD